MPNYGDPIPHRSGTNVRPNLDDVGDDATLDGLSRSELQDLAREAGLSTSGNMATLRRRLTDANTSTD